MVVKCSRVIMLCQSIESQVPWFPATLYNYNMGHSPNNYELNIEVQSPKYIEIHFWIFCQKEKKLKFFNNFGSLINYKRNQSNEIVVEV